jgi:hypothetical protein
VEGGSAQLAHRLHLHHFHLLAAHCACATHQLGTQSTQSSNNCFLANIHDGKISIVADPHSFHPDPDPAPAFLDEYRSGSGSNKDPDPIRNQGFKDQKLKKKNYC